MDTPSLLLTGGTASVLISILMQFIFKPTIELFFDNTHKVHDPLVRALAVVLGILVAFAMLGLPVTGLAALTLVSQGVFLGLGSIGLYHGLVGTDAAQKVEEPPLGKL